MGVMWFFTWVLSEMSLVVLARTVLSVVSGTKGMGWIGFNFIVGPTAVSVAYLDGLFSNSFGWGLLLPGLI
jgi:hypothetical protein